MRSRRNQLSIAAVALVLGLLVVLQLKVQSASTGLQSLSAQELTQLVANVNTRNDQLRAEVASTERELADLESATNRGESSADQLRRDLARVRAWTGLDPVSGPGVRISVSGPIDGSGIQDLLNELRNAGAEALAVDDVRVVQGTVVAGRPGGLSVLNTGLGDAFEITAIGNPTGLTGSLTRSGGIIAQLGATFPDAQLTVVPVDLLALPATAQDLAPAHGTPSL
jgi:uncharacterized protein YlxW (UPF0749 family)